VLVVVESKLSVIAFLCIFAWFSKYLCNVLPLKMTLVIRFELYFRVICILNQVRKAHGLTSTKPTSRKVLL
jgi:hypothetical protein